MVRSLGHRQTKGAATDNAEPNATAPHLDSTYSVEKLRITMIRKFKGIFQSPGARITDQLCRSESRQAGFSCGFCYPLVNTVRNDAQIANEIAAHCKTEFFNRIDPKPTFLVARKSHIMLTNRAFPNGRGIKKPQQISTKPNPPKDGDKKLIALIEATVLEIYCVDNKLSGYIQWHCLEQEF